MSRLPLDLGRLHFVGIGGIGMSGIAEVLHNLGYQVQGSDVAESANVKRLRDMGIPVAVGHREENLGDASVVIISSAIKGENPEVAEARERYLPIVRRAEMLAELMRLKWSVAIGGTHGKTTTTSLVASILDAGGMDPTVINGGIINAYGTNARLGQGDWMVVEADESDGSFTKLPSTIAVVTNIDPEHMEHYGSEETLHKAFETFIENIPFYGLAVLCIDHPVVQAMIGRIQDRRILAYGFSPQADIRAVDVTASAEGMEFSLVARDRPTGEVSVIQDLMLPMPGKHNVLNSLAAIAVGLELGIPEESIRKALAGFGGVKRRFTKTGSANGITVIDDYGHHPVEISAVLAAAREKIEKAGKGRIIAVMQPHRYTRLHDLFEAFCSCFNDADHVIIADVYAAGEAPIAGADRDALVEGLRARGHRHAIGLEDPDKLAEVIAPLTRPGDLVICLGAGNITAWAHELPERLAEVMGDGKDATGGEA